MGTPGPEPDVDLPGRAGVPTWEEVARDYGPFLFNLCYRLTGDPNDAEDLVQETLLRVRRGLRTYKPGSMEAWLTRIATNVFIDRVRRRRRRPETLYPDGPAELAVNSTAAAEDDYIGASLSRDVQAALDELPVEYRLAVVLCDISGLSYEQAADALSVPVGTVRSRLHRGRAALRKALA